LAKKAQNNGCLKLDFFLQNFNQNMALKIRNSIAKAQTYFATIGRKIQGNNLHWDKSKFEIN